MKFTFDDGDCRLCGNYTETVFNIKFKRVSICEDCANAVTKQQVMDKCK